MVVPTVEEERSFVYGAIKCRLDICASWIFPVCVFHFDDHFFPILFPTNSLSYNTWFMYLLSAEKVPWKTVSALFLGLPVSLASMAIILTSESMGLCGALLVPRVRNYSHFSPKAKVLTKKNVLTWLLGSILIFKGEWRSQNVCTFSKQVQLYLE